MNAIRSSVLGIILIALGLAAGVYASGKRMFTVDLNEGYATALGGIPFDAEHVQVVRLAPEDAPLKLLVTFYRPGSGNLQLRFYTMDVAELGTVPVDPICPPTFVRVETSAGVGCVPRDHPLARPR